MVGPVGTQRFVDRTLEMLADDIGYRLAHHADLTEGPDVEVTEVEDGVAFDEGGVRVMAAPTDHAPVRPTVGYRVDHDGRAVVIAGDTVPCPGLDRLCAGADVYVQTVDPPVADPPASRRPASRTSSTTTRRSSRPPRRRPAPAWTPWC